MKFVHFKKKHNLSNIYCLIKNLIFSLHQKWMKDDYKLLNVVVGEGSFGKVSLAKTKAGDIVAVKQISKQLTNSQ